jgi:HEPN domain-containing protein
MMDFFKIKRYNWALFLGHLVIEKLLKAYYVKINSNHPPLIHDLLKLAIKSNLTLTDDQKFVLDNITTFNINARYDDYKLAFYKRCTLEYT